MRIKAAWRGGDKFEEVCQGNVGRRGTYRHGFWGGRKRLGEAECVYMSTAKVSAEVRGFRFEV